MFKWYCFLGGMVIEIILVVSSIILKMTIGNRGKKYRVLSAEELSYICSKIKTLDVDVKIIGGKTNLYRPVSRTVVFQEKNIYSVYDIFILLHEIYHDKDRKMVIILSSLRFVENFFVYPCSIILILFFFTGENGNATALSILFINLIALFFILVFTTIKNRWII